MKITRIKLENWRNFQTADVQLQNRVFLIGPNASGKSNFLDAFLFLRDIAKEGGGLSAAVRKRGDIKKIRCLFARSKPKIILEVELADEENNWVYSISFFQETSGHRRVLIDKEIVKKNGKIILDRPLESDEEDKDQLMQTHLEQISANKEFRDIAKYFSKINYLHLIPQLIKHPELTAGSKMSENPFGTQFFKTIMSESKTNRDSRFKKISAALKIVVPQLDELKVVQDKEGIPHIETIFKHWRPHAGKQNELDLSDGTLRLIGLLWTLLSKDPLLLLEEPEISLHSEIVKLLPTLITKTQKQHKKKLGQIIISTHSPDMLDDKGIGGEEVLLLIPESEGTKIVVSSDIEDIKQMLESGFPVSEAAYPYTEPFNRTTKKGKSDSQLDLFGVLK